MIVDTNEIKNHWNNFEFGLVLDVDESTIFALFHDLKTLMKSHDELEQKLKFYEPVVCHYAFLEVNDSGDDNFPACEALTAAGYTKENPVTPEETIPQILRRKLKIAEDCLEIYADAKNWNDKIQINGGEMATKIEMVGAKCACEALKQIRGE